MERKHWSEMSSLFHNGPYHIYCKPEQIRADSQQFSCEFCEIFNNTHFVFISIDILSSLNKLQQIFRKKNPKYILILNLQKCTKSLSGTLAILADRHSLNLLHGHTEKEKCFGLVLHFAWFLMVFNDISNAMVVIPL